jgi:aspartyl protease family protein
MARTYLIFLVIAGMFGAMVGTCSRSGTFSAVSSAPKSPELETAYVTEARTPSYDQVDSSYASEGAVELNREEDGHFYADVEINNTPVRVLVDTGASGIALSRDDARRAGLATSIGMYDVVGEGAGGDVRGEYVKLETVRLGKQVAHEVPAIVLDGGQQSLLGQSFLRQFETVEIKGDRMVLR